MAGIGKKGNFADLVADGENPNGVRVEGAFGISHGGIGPDYYTQWDFGKNAAGSRWGGPAETLAPPGFPVLGVDSGEGADLKGDRLKGGR